MSPLVLNSRTAYCAGALLAIALGAALLLGLARQHSDGLALGDYHVYQCAVDGARSDKTFTFLAVSSVYAQQIGDSLCRSPLMARHYGRVRISWKPRNLLTGEQVLNEDYDLIWSRTHNMRGLVPDFASYYDTLLRYDHYRVYWFSRVQRPQLTAAFFRGKKIGLLNDSLSHTHYLLPLASLKAAGIDFASEQLVYFDDAMNMYQAFARGDLDLISAGSWLQRDLDVPLYRTLIADNATAGAVFVRKRHPAEIDCAIIAALQAFSGSLADTRMHLIAEHHCDVPG